MFLVFQSKDSDDMDNYASPLDSSLSLIDLEAVDNTNILTMVNTFYDQNVLMYSVQPQSFAKPENMHFNYRVFHKN